MSAYPGFLKIIDETGSGFFELMKKQQRIRLDMIGKVFTFSVKQGKHKAYARRINTVLEQREKVFPLHGFDTGGNEMF